MGYVDLHSHVLYGLDDGAPDAATARAMLDGLATLGVSEQCATPHQKANQYLPSWDLIEATFGALDADRAPHHPTLRLGAENMWDDVFLGRLAANEIPRYRGTQAFLIEVPPAVMPPALVDQLFKLRVRGLVPALAHPERYHALWDALTSAAEFASDDLLYIERWVESLNELGFDVEEMDIVAEPDGARVRLQPRVVEAGHHRRELLSLTGLDVEEAQARRLLNDMAAYSASRDLGRLPREVVANRWYTDIWERVMSMVPREMRGRLEPAEIFHEVLQHRWFLSERVGHSVDFFEAVQDYIHGVLATKPVEVLPDAEEEAALSVE